MNDTAFSVPREKWDRLVALFKQLAYQAIID
jgi:hypothetical protein